MIFLLLGSGPSAVEARAWSRAPFDRIVAINNAWRVRPDWDDLIYPFDFPDDRMPPARAPQQRFIDERDFVPANNAYGGFLYAGATMAFTATYWALHELKPRVIAYFGCDMVYAPAGPTHFYGAGTADPLRADPSLASLEAKSARARVLAARQGCALVNLSRGPSRLIFERVGRDDLTGVAPPTWDHGALTEALKLEASLGYETPTGFHDHIEPDMAALRQLDLLWIRASSGASTAKTGARARDSAVTK